MCDFGGDSSGDAAAQAEASRELQRKLQQSAPPPPKYADEEIKQSVVQSVRTMQNMRGVRATFLTPGGIAGDPEY